MTPATERSPDPDRPYRRSRTACDPSGVLHEGVSEAELWRAASGGDEGARDALYYRSVPLAYKVVLRKRLGDKHAAMAAADDAFLRAIDGYDPGLGAFSAFLTDIAVKLAIDALRRWDRGRVRGTTERRFTISDLSAVGDVPAGDPDDDFAAGEARVDVRRALEAAVEEAGDDPRLIAALTNELARLIGADHETMEALGARFGCHKSTISRECKRLLAAMRSAIEEK